jgi:glycosyltransferase involved in cell wall biosynthesis
MMKVLHVGAKNYPPNHGGTERVVYNIVNSIDDVEFLIMVEWDQEESDHIVPIPKGLGYIGRLFYIFNYIKMNAIDIVHFHNEKYIPMAAFISIFRKGVVLTDHGAQSKNPKYSILVRSLFKITEIFGATFIRRMTFCSEYDQIQMSKIIPFRKCYFVNNGTDICETSQKESDIIYPDTYVYLGRITPQKNIVNLIKVSDQQMIKVDIYGNFDKDCPEYTKEVMDLLDKSQYVKYKGVISYDQVFETIKKYKAFLYLTIMEGLPLSVLEAASCGMYLILSDIPYHTYLSMPAVSYINLKDMKIPNPEQIGSGRENRDHIIRNFSNQEMGKNYKKIYNSLIK